MRAHIDRKITYSFGILMLIIAIYGIYSSDQAAQAINLRDKNSTMQEQKQHFNAVNLTKSLTVSDAWYTEYELKIPSSAKLIIPPPGIHRDYWFTVTNSSTKIIDVIVVVFKRNNAITRVADSFYKHARHGVKPQESVEVQVRGVKPDLTGAIEAVIFRDGTYEGTPWVAEAKIAHYKAMDAKMVELMTLFQARGLLSARTDMVIRSNVNEMKALVNGERGRYKAKINFYDTRDFEENRGILNGIHMIDVALTQIERNSNQQAVRDFTARISELTGTERFEK